MQANFSYCPNPAKSNEPLVLRDFNDDDFHITIIALALWSRM